MNASLTCAFRIRVEDEFHVVDLQRKIRSHEDESDVEVWRGLCRGALSALDYHPQTVAEIIGPDECEYRPPTAD